MKFIDVQSVDGNPSDKTKSKSKRVQRKLIKLENKPSFRGLLIRSYVSFTLITFLSIILIFLLANWLNRYETINLSTAELPDYVEYFRTGEYAKIPTSSIFGVDGWFEVVKADGTSVYSSTGTSQGYSKNQLALIKKYGSDEVVTTTEYVDDANVVTYVITRSYTQGGKKHNAYVILDEDFNVINGDLGYEVDAYTQDEYDLLAWESEHQKDVFAKYLFASTSGEPMYIVFLDTNNNVTFQFGYIIGITIGIAVIIYGFVMALYIQYINRNVQQPLIAISLAMRRFAKEGDREHIEYKGPIEFEQLADSFNEMVTLLNASENEKAEIEKRRQIMLAGLSHDLKTPITIIQGFSKAIRDGVVADKDKQKYLDLIVSKSENMGELINSFYEFSKLDHPDFAFDKQRADVAELVRSHIAMIYGEFSIRGYNVETDITEEQLFAVVDAPMMARVIDNLTSNFFKYTPVGSTLFVSVQKQDDNVKIVFADNGPGIPKDSRKDIFEPFVVGEKSRNKQGSGLGLAVCHKIITSLDGTITLSDNPRTGYVTEFDITLPLADIDNTI